MSAMRVRRKLDSDTLHVPELRPFIGQMVEIVVLEGKADNERLTWTPGCFDDMTPAIPVDESTKAALALVLTPAQLEALVDVANQGGPDVDAIRKLRAASMT
jgi:hypothetical protein